MVVDAVFNNELPNPLTVVPLAILEPNPIGDIGPTLGVALVTSVITLLTTGEGGLMTLELTFDTSGVPVGVLIGEGNLTTLDGEVPTTEVVGAGLNTFGVEDI